MTDMGPNEKALTELYEKMRGEGMKKFHISWAEGANDLSREERAKVALDALQEANDWHNLSEYERMKIQVKDVYRSLRKADDLYRQVRHSYGFDRFRELMENPVFKGAEKMMGGIERALMILGNYITADDRKEMKKEDKSEQA